MSERILLKRNMMLAVYGPSKVSIHSGQVLVSGRLMNKGEFIVPSARGVTIIAVADSVVELIQGSNSQYIVFNDISSISAWLKFMKNIVEGGYKRVIVVGPPDTGKSTLVLWLYNMSQQLSMIETDIGQNEHGYPASLTCAEPPQNRYYFMLQDIEPNYAWFVGHVRVDLVIPRHYLAIVNARRVCGQKFVADTDGYVYGAGYLHKVSVVEILEPELVIELRKPGEDCMFNSLRSLVDDYMCIESPYTHVKTRRTIDRRSFRNMMYSRLFREAKRVSVDTGLVANLCSVVEEEGCRYYYCEGKLLTEVYCKPRGVQKSSKRYVRLRSDWGKGLIAGIRLNSGYDIPAVVERISIDKNTVIINVPVRHYGLLRDNGIKYVFLGFIRLDSMFREVEKYQPGVFPLTLIRDKSGMQRTQPPETGGRT